MNILPTITITDRLAELQEERQALELTSEITSYADFADQFLTLATKFFDIGAMSGYAACMKRYQYYASLAENE